MAQKKIGRPKSDNPMDERIYLRVTNETKEKIKICAEELNMTVSDIIRKGIDHIFDGLKK